MFNKCQNRYNYYGISFEGTQMLCAILQKTSKFLPSTFVSVVSAEEGDYEAFKNSSAVIILILIHINYVFIISSSKNKITVACNEPVAFRCRL